MKFFGLFLVVGFLCLQRGDAGFLEDLDGKVWNTVDQICHSVAYEVEKTTGPADTLFLRIVEYTTLGIRSHSVFPSAAASLLRSSHFDPSKKTVIFLHGFTDSPYLLSGQTFAAAYKLHGGYNILALDASMLIKMLYLRSSILVKYIGETLGVVVDDLVRRGVSPENIHLVGHSLGAHIGGFAGKSYQFVQEGAKLPRITGMDPAGPCFFSSPPEERLDKEDARFVDIIHTNAGVYGINKTIGVVDFYPNGGGMEQPGCVESICSHNRVWQLWEESVVRTNGFIGTQCDSYHSWQKKQCNSNKESFMGYATSNSTAGDYYLRTNFIPLFGLGSAGAKPSVFSNVAQGSGPIPENHGVNRFIKY